MNKRDELTIAAKRSMNRRRHTQGRHLAPSVHRRRHEILHRHLDELIADWIAHTGRLPSEHTILELENWSSTQQRSPDHEEERN
jgi:hypothetical protein